MDFVTFENFSDNDVLPSPQPSLSLPLKSNIENLSSRFTNFKDLKSLLKQQNVQEGDPAGSELNLADEYAKASIKLLDGLSDGSHDSQHEGAASDRIRSEALSIRLSRALNPNVSDTRMRELIDVLEPKLINISQIADSGIDGSLARKNLRGDVEADLIASNVLCLSNYSIPIGNLKQLGDRLLALNLLIEETSDLLSGDLDATNNLRKELIKHSSERTSLSMKKSLLVSFRQKFALNEYELFLLTSDEINSDFFEALKRAESINNACPVLLALDNPELGNTIMTKTSSLIDGANKKIIKFCSRSLSSTTLLYHRENLSKLHLCLEQLKQRPDQLVEIMSAFVESRSSALLEEFYQQVSGYETNQLLLNDNESRPVYLSSHDPVRFVTDLLAYVHSSVANESEMIFSLLQGNEHLISISEEIVHKIVGALASPIKSKIEEVVTVEPKLSILYQVFCVLELYLVMFNKSTNAPIISSSIEDGIDCIREKFKILLSNRLSAIRDSNLAKLELSNDLQPPEWIIEYYSDLLPILDSMDSSTIFAGSKQEHEEFLQLVTDRPIKTFDHHLSLVSSNFNEMEKMLIELNFLDLIVSKIITINILGDKMLEINHKINQISYKIQEIHFQTLLHDCALTDFFNVMNMIYPTEDDLSDASLYSVITESKIFSNELIGGVDLKIQSVIPTALLDVQQNMLKLNNPIVVSDIVSQSSSRFIKFYKLFFEAVENFVGDSLLTWSDHEIATLLGVEPMHYTR